jgi:3-deoxy-D-manno-octulosonate 8-phosphate phosphatase (KDO 8-P phosphatase)
MDNVLALFKSVTTFFFDMDGVLTDGSLLVMPNGVWLRRMNIKDGYALQLAVKKGYRVAIFSGSNSDEVKDRLSKLGITDVYMNVKDKASAVGGYMQRNFLKPEQVLSMGDDIPDLEMLKASGVAACPADAVQEIKAVSHYISHMKGGEGCARDVIEKVMKLRADWNNDTTVASR